MAAPWPGANTAIQPAPLHQASTSTATPPPAMKAPSGTPTPSPPTSASSPRPPRSRSFNANPPLLPLRHSLPRISPLDRPIPHAKLSVSSGGLYAFTCLKIIPPSRPLNRFFDLSSEIWEERHEFRASDCALHVLLGTRAPRLDHGLATWERSAEPGSQCPERDDEEGDGETSEAGSGGA
ncbi:hypothetical protein BGZ57DRAFT_928333 [Hyaloscypha finlandica]|nr:hypothetical protein BGZ57DRAFT_928333 [Hyaloscypha finlandica]